MAFSLSTNWNAHRHDDGEAVVDDILNIGFSEIECGWNLTVAQSLGIRRRVAERAVTISSVHAFCPCANTGNRGPETYSIAAVDPRAREEAMAAVRDTLEFSIAIGAKRMVLHAGRAAIRPLSPALMRLARDGLLDSRRYRRRFLRLLDRREHAMPSHMDALTRSLDTLLPWFEDAGATLCLENLPEWEAVPAEAEMVSLLRRFDTPAFGYWHDFGHAHLREQLGFAPHRSWAMRLRPWCRGLHVHDNRDFIDLHLMPPHGSIHFEAFAFLGDPSIPWVLEPHPDAPPEIVRDAANELRVSWRVSPTHQ